MATATGSLKLFLKQFSFSSVLSTYMLVLICEREMEGVGERKAIKGELCERVSFVCMCVCVCKPKHLSPFENFSSVPPATFCRPSRRLQGNVSISIVFMNTYHTRAPARDRAFISAPVLYVHTRPSSEQLGLDVNVQRSREFLAGLSRTRCIAPAPYGILLPALRIRAAAAAG